MREAETLFWVGGKFGDTGAEESGESKGKPIEETAVAAAAAAGRFTDEEEDLCCAGWEAVRDWEDGGDSGWWTAGEAGLRGELTRMTGLEGGGW